MQQMEGRRTAILALGTKPDKLESLEVSIALFLTELNLTNNPEAVQLLSMLCQLSDGLYQWKEQLPIVGATFQDIDFLFSLLCDRALIFMDGSRLKVLSPIKHYVTQSHPVDEAHTQGLERFFWSLVDQYATRGPGPRPGFVEAVKMLEPDMRNISSLVAKAIQSHPSPQIVEIA